MKPHRLALTHSLVLNYGLYKKMEVSLYSDGSKALLEAKGDNPSPPPPPPPPSVMYFLVC